MTTSAFMILVCVFVAGAFAGAATVLVLACLMVSKEEPRE